MIFESMSDAKIAKLVESAGHRVILATPSVRSLSAESLVAALKRPGVREVTVVLDCSEEVFRLGYGDLGAVTSLMESGCEVRQAPGLRIGILVCDDRAWVFAPTALYVQTEVHSDETPNCVGIHPLAAARLVRAIAGPGFAQGVPDDSPSGSESGRSGGGREIGMVALSEERRYKVEDCLREAPPIEFDIARQVRVFQPYLQYVDIRLKGAAIQRHRLEVPQSVQGLDQSNDMASRLRTTFELLGRDSEVSSKRLEAELRQIRDDWTRPLGSPWGRVILRAARVGFDERVTSFREAVKKHREKVQESLEKLLEASRQDLVSHFLPLAVERPPDGLLGQLSGPPDEQQVRAWLNHELDRVFPRAGDLIEDIELQVQFRDVTYETLNEEGFLEALKKAYPHVDWDKPYEQFQAARERT